MLTRCKNGQAAPQQGRRGQEGDRQVTRNYRDILKITYIHTYISKFITRNTVKQSSNKRRGMVNSHSAGLYSGSFENSPRIFGQVCNAIKNPVTAVNNGQYSLQSVNWNRVTLNNASDYRTNGLYRTPNPNPYPNPSP